MCSKSLCVPGLNLRIPTQDDEKAIEAFLQAHFWLLSASGWFLPTTGRHGNLILELTELQIETVTTGFHLSPQPIPLLSQTISKIETQKWFSMAVFLSQIATFAEGEENTKS